MSWERLSYFSTWEYSIIELPDGALARVSLDYHMGEQRVTGDLYLARSQDGISWSSPVKINPIENKVVLSEGATEQRSMASYVVTLLASLAALVLVIRIRR